MSIGFGVARSGIQPSEFNKLTLKRLKVLIEHFSSSDVSSDDYTNKDTGNVETSQADMVQMQEKYREKHGS